nr:PREDICTED: uncharacterized protein LOC105661903 [Megachile rotundata]
MEGSTNDFLRRDAFFLACLMLLGSAICPCHGKIQTPMHMAQLTQKGYIQFLRWELPVPEITEFTFCLWVQSNDLTHPHSIFSYSKNERERLVRSWISPKGRSVHLEIGGKQVVASATEIREKRWYHVCLSWENRVGLYGLWINGQLWARGQSDETVGHVIPSGGDIVLGQEYTDFDKGLEEGIEGSVLGFNLLLASAFDPSARGYGTESGRNPIALPSGSGYPSYGNRASFPSISTKPPQHGIGQGSRTLRVFFPNLDRLRGPRYADGFRSSQLRPTNRTVSDQPASGTRTISSPAWIGGAETSEEPLGLRLVKLSYVRCEIGRGSPFIGGSLMLISWSRTPVRVFGGAILKNAKSECGNF